MVLMLYIVASFVAVEEAIGHASNPIPAWKIFSAHEMPPQYS